MTALVVAGLAGLALIVLAAIICVISGASLDAALADVDAPIPFLPVDAPTEEDVAWLRAIGVDA